jgi:hypothetical protein
VALKGAVLHNLGLKGRIHSLVGAAVLNSFHGFYLLCLLLGIAITAVSLRRSDKNLAALGLVVAGAGFLHLACASLGAGYRYEDYLIAAGIVVTACVVPELRRHNRRVSVAGGLLLFCSGVFLSGRSLQAAAYMPQYSRAIYLQQYQTAAFLATYYPGGGIAANDIGLINFRTPLHSVDLVGLASREVFLAKREGRFATQELDHIAASRNLHVAVLYDTWFLRHPVGFWEGPSIPSTWTRVARWKSPQLLQLGGETVSFYAIQPQDVSALRANLQQFEQRLPPDITVLP